MRITLCFSLVLLLFAATVNAKIIFSVGGFGKSKIYAMNDNGRYIRKIGDTQYSDWRPVWSPNGRQIVFLRDITPNDSSGNNDIYIMNADGTGDRQLLDRKGTIRDLRISPNGTKVLYITSYLGLNILDIGTLTTEKILPNTHGYHCDWSPDGKQIVFINDDHDVIEKNLWIVDANGENPQQFTYPDPAKGKIHRILPRWSPDGNQILFAEIDLDVKEFEGNNGVIHHIKADGMFRYVIKDIDDGDTRTLKIPNNWYPSSLNWMNGQQSVLFSTYEYEDRKPVKPIVEKIYKYNLATDEITFLTEGSGPHWINGELPISPIGKQSVRWAELKAK